MGHVYVDALLYGEKAKKRVRMLVDTGSTYLLISPKLARELGSPKLPFKIPTSYATEPKRNLKQLPLDWSIKVAGVALLL